MATVNSWGSVRAVSCGSAVITAEIAGKKATCKVTVVPASLADATIYLYQTEYPYIGGPVQASVKYVVKNGNSIFRGTDYTLSFNNNVNVGTATVIATGTGNYTGTTSTTYTITPRDLSDAYIYSPGTQTYTGSQIKPTPKVTLSNNELTPGVDFTFSYGANIEPETGGTITITAKGSNGTYGVDKPCTRGQIMTFIWRYAGQQKPKSNVSPFKDSITPAYRTAVLWGVGLKITKGFPDGTFRDKAPCTRGQIVTFLYRIKNWAYKG